MGLFLALAGVIDVQEANVIAALSDYTKIKNGIFQTEKRSTDEEDTLVVHSANGNTCLLFPSNFMQWWETSEALSLSLKKAVLSLHIHDEDLWMYILYKNGIQIDAFNPIPDYWTDNVSEQEREANRGNVEIVSRCVHGIQPSDIEKYFVTWDLDSDNEVKAYPEDKYPYGDCWQMLDFMKKLRLPYPMNSSGQPLGSTYQFKIPPPPSKRK